MRQKFITKCVRPFITKCDSFIRKCDIYYIFRRFYYKILQLLQNTTVQPDIMNRVFKLRNTPHYNLRYTSHFSTDQVHSAYNWTESASYVGPKIWEQIPAEIKNKDSLDGFNKQTKKMKPTQCPCRNCKTFVPNLGFFW